MTGPSGGARAFEGGGKPVEPVREAHRGLDDHLDGQRVEGDASAAHERLQTRRDDGVRVLGAASEPAPSNAFKNC